MIVRTEGNEGEYDDRTWNRFGEDWKVVFCPNFSSMLTINNLELIKVIHINSPESGFVPLNICRGVCVVYMLSQVYGTYTLIPASNE